MLLESPRLLGDDAEDLVFAHDEMLFAVDLDLLAGVLAEQDRVAFLDVEREALAVILLLAGADGDYFALLGLLFRRVGDDDSADLLFAFLDTLDDDAVVKRSYLHVCQLRESDMSLSVTLLAGNPYAPRASTPWARLLSICPGRGPRQGGTSA